jgi:nicotinate-nucleotide adenylyltransferase
MKIGVYGGTFDPPHLGHMEAARAAMAALDLDRLFFIPDYLPPHKKLPDEGAGPEDRLAMVSLMADGLGPKAQALDLELRREGKSYTADTLADLRRDYPEDELWLLMGSDMFFTLQNWHAPEEIFSLAGIAAFARSREDRKKEMDRQALLLESDYGARVRVLDLPQITEISSTLLRDDLGKGRDAEFLWRPVYGYILRQGLYGTRADLRNLTDDQLRAVSWSMVRAKRIPHIQGTEAEAVRLAQRWGAHPELARRAAILHDCTKYLTLEEQLHLCEKYGILLDNLERVTVKLLHAKTGAALARHLFGQPEEVCQAIYWHTTGKAGMSTLEKVLYLADYMEPSRDFDGVEELRRLAYQDLDQAVILGLSMTVEEMAQRGVPVHSNTLSALEDLKGKSTQC